MTRWLKSRRTPQSCPDSLKAFWSACWRSLQRPQSRSPMRRAWPPKQSRAGPPPEWCTGPYYYFYQADDCQQMFLHPVNVRCLLREYGSLEASPDSITATVVEIVGHTVTEEIRRRHRYLAHLPLTCEFSICELSLQPPIISKETLDTFADDLEKRKRLRQKKVRDEKRREKRIEIEENKKQGKYPEVHIGLENLHHFPAFGSPPYSSSPPVQPDFTFAPPSPLSSSPTSDGITFPSLNDNLLAPPATADSDGESDGSDRVPVPSFQNSFSQAIEKALLQLDNGAASPPQPAALDPDERGGKKKKKKQKLLFSTSMVHTKVSRQQHLAQRQTGSDLQAGSGVRLDRAQSAEGEQEAGHLLQVVQVQQKQSEDEARETDSQYGTWETGLRTDDSLTPATPSSESNLSPSPRKPTSPHTPGDQFDSDTLDGLPPSSSSESQTLPFPDAPVTLLDTSALRSRAQLGKKRAPRTRPSRAARQNMSAPADGDGGTNEDWLYRDSTEAKVQSKDNDSDSEEPTRGADAGPAVASQPQRIALFPGMDPSALKAQLKKRGDSDNQTEGPSPSQLSRSPKSPFLPRAARVLPPAGGKENGEEDSPQWLKELKSKKRLSQYENES
ncbi:RING finger protein 10 [Larimichthys crocea]|uniref:Uncharacterized protein n=1 Tax=Larimichthys crocea TaxID=215358 RepID=A0ACD3Q885_LARCR|nr:RING finger protein 10 [Larimichthys crocea]